MTAGKVSGLNRGNLTTDSNPYKFSVYRNSALNIAGSSDVKIPFDSEQYDTNNNFDSTTNNRYAAPVSGYYHFDALVSAAAATNGFQRIMLYVNGSLAKQGARVYSPTTGTLLQSGISTDYPLTAGDYVEIFVQQNSANPAAVTVGIQNTWFTGHYISRT